MVQLREVHAGRILPCNHYRQSHDDGLLKMLLSGTSFLFQVQDEAYSQAYPVISNALITIFYSLNESYPQYVEQVGI